MCARCPRVTSQTHNSKQIVTCLGRHQVLQRPVRKSANTLTGVQGARSHPSGLWSQREGGAVTSEGDPAWRGRHPLHVHATMRGKTRMLRLIHLSANSFSRKCIRRTADVAMMPAAGRSLSGAYHTACASHASYNTLCRHRDAMCSPAPPVVHYPTASVINLHFCKKLLKILQAVRS